GSILAVMDVRLLLGAGRRDATEASRLIVLGAGAPELGVIADATDGQAMLEASAVLDPADTVGVRHPWIRGTTRDALVILDGDLLLKDERLYASSADRHS